MDRGRAKSLYASLKEAVAPSASVGSNGGASGPAFPQLSASSAWRGSVPGMLDCWSGLDRCARMVITIHRDYVAGNRYAEKALAARQDLRLNCRRLDLVDPTGMSELETLLGVEEDEVRTICLRRRERGGHLLMRAVRVGVDGGVPLLGVVFWVAGEDFEVEWPDFRPIFGLTTAEAKIVEQLVQGVGAEAIAATLQVSINTVRTHISHVYEKLGITCREQLWRRLAPYRIN